MTTTVVLVHSHFLFLEGLRHNLIALPEFRIVGNATHGQQAIQVVSESEPDILVMDVDLPGVSGLEVARVIKRNHPHVSIVLLSASMESHYIVKAMRAGISAWLPRNTSWDVLHDTLYAIRRGHYPINDMVLAMPEIASEVLTAFRQMSVDGESVAIYSPLSPRELQVLELVAERQTNKEIASMLEISNQTVKNHISSILRKLAVNDRTQAVVYAVRHGWLNVPDTGNRE